MPIYEYECAACGKVFEEWNKSFDDVESPCACGGNARRIVSNTAFVLKGSGWYVTDYNGKKSSGNGNGNGNGNGDAKAESAGSSDAAASASAADAGAAAPAPAKSAADA